MTDGRIDKWRGWLEGAIYRDVMTIHMHRFVFREVGNMVRTADLPPSYFWDYLRDTYATSQALAVRRLAEQSPRVVSLGRLLHEVASDAGRLTREGFVDLYDPADRDFAGRVFADEFGGAVGTHLDPAIAQADQAQLIETAAAVKAYVDEHVAHKDARGKAEIPTFDDLDAAVDQVGELFRKYVRLFTASDYVTLVPVIQNHDWTEIFRVPWITSQWRRQSPWQ